MHGSWNYDEKPLLVFWETTKACLLACKHCRAEAVTKPLPGELSLEEGEMLIDQVAGFGKPSPILVFTGGDPLMRRDIWRLLEYSVGRGVRTAIAPSVTPLLTPTTLDRLLSIGVRSISLSLDSGVEEVHDSIRGIRGTWRRTVEMIGEAARRGMMIQVNTVVMRNTVETLPETLSLIVRLGAKAWEVFYYVPTGRGGEAMDLTPWEYEDVSHYLYDASKYGIPVRTTEGPMFRRVVAERKKLEESGGDPAEAFRLGPLYKRLTEKTRRLLGEPRTPPLAHTTGTRDGRGIIFVSYNGTIYPSGFLPLPLGNIRTSDLRDVYRHHPVLRGLRTGELLKGRCRICPYRNICGGSRARAYAYTGDPYAEDPACPYNPAENSLR